MESFFTYENVKELLVYSCFGALVGIVISYIAYIISSGIKLIIKILWKR